MRTHWKGRKISAVVEVEDPNVGVCLDWPIRDDEGDRTYRACPVWPQGESLDFLECEVKFHESSEYPAFNRAVVESIARRINAGAKWSALRDFTENFQAQVMVGGRGTGRLVREAPDQLLSILARWVKSDLPMGRYELRTANGIYALSRRYLYPLLLALAPDGILRAITLGHNELSDRRAEAADWKTISRIFPIFPIEVEFVGETNLDFEALLRAPKQERISLEDYFRDRIEPVLGDRMIPWLEEPLRDRYRVPGESWSLGDLEAMVRFKAGDLTELGKVMDAALRLVAAARREREPAKAAELLAMSGSRYRLEGFEGVMFHTAACAVPGGIRRRGGTGDVLCGIGELIAASMMPVGSCVQAFRSNRRSGVIFGSISIPYEVEWAKPEAGHDLIEAAGFLHGWLRERAGVGSDEAARLIAGLGDPVA